MSTGLTLFFVLVAIVLSTHALRITNPDANTNIERGALFTVAWSNVSAGMNTVAIELAQGPNPNALKTVETLQASVPTVMGSWLVRIYSQAGNNYYIQLRGNNGEVATQGLLTVFDRIGITPSASASASSTTSSFSLILPLTSFSVISRTPSPSLSQPTFSASSSPSTTSSLSSSLLPSFSAKPSSSTSPMRSPSDSSSDSWLTSGATAGIGVGAVAAAALAFASIIFLCRKRSNSDNDNENEDRISEIFRNPIPPPAPAQTGHYSSQPDYHSTGAVSTETASPYYPPQQPSNTYYYNHSQYYPPQQPGSTYNDSQYYPPHSYPSPVSQRQQPSYYYNPQSQQHTTMPQPQHYPAYF